jgi:hypothetical protein
VIQTDSAPAISFRLRAAVMGEILPPNLLAPTTTRRIDGLGVLIPGSGPLDGYLARLAAAETDFRAWDGRVLLLEADGVATHRLLIVDRYGQVYDVTDAAQAEDLPDVGALEEWFRFLATACPECGVLDDPVARGPVP